MRRPLIALVLATAAAALGGGLLWTVAGRWWTLVAAQRALPGRPEAEVYARLGTPTYVLGPGDVKGKPLDALWKEMHFVPVPSRRVTGKALLYRRTDRAAYVFVSPQGRVEAVELAGT